MFGYHAPADAATPDTSTAVHGLRRNSKERLRPWSSSSKPAERRTSKERLWPWSRTSPCVPEKQERRRRSTAPAMMAAGTNRTSAAAPSSQAACSDLLGTLCKMQRSHVAKQERRRARSSSVQLPGQQPGQSEGASRASEPDRRCDGATGTGAAAEPRACGPPSGLSGLSLDLMEEENSDDEEEGGLPPLVLEAMRAEQRRRGVATC